MHTFRKLKVLQQGMDFVEVMTASEIAQQLGYCSPDETQALLSEAGQISAMIVGLSRSLD